MKKLTTLVFALLFTAGIAFGQNNDAEIVLTGSGNDATIEQTGSSNFARIKMTGEDGTGIIKQVGDNNFARSDKEGNQKAGILDEGDQNYTRIRQIGDDNKAQVTLTGTSFSNEVYLDQGVSANNTTKSKARMTIGGRNNVVDVDQRDGKQTARLNITTGSNRNQVTIFQESNGTYPSSNLSEVSIDGDDNLLDIFQHGVDNSAYVDLINDADNNIIDIDQTGTGHVATVTINGGDSNTATITQN